MNKGIIMEITTKRLVVMTPEGLFVKLPKKNLPYSVGEEIQFAIPNTGWGSLPFRFSSVLVAAMILGIVLFTTFSFIGDGQVAAYYTLDVNPGVEFGIDVDEKVIKARALNPDGAELLKLLVYQNRNLEDVTKAVMERLEQNGTFGQGIREIVITGTIMKSAAFPDEAVILNKMKQIVKAEFGRNHPQQTDNIQVTALSTPQEMRKQAIKDGISTGKLAVKLIIDTEIEKEKEKTASTPNAEATSIPVKGKPQVDQTTKDQPKAKETPDHKEVMPEKQRDIDKTDETKDNRANTTDGGKANTTDDGKANATEGEKDQENNGDSGHDRNLNKSYEKSQLDQNDDEKSDDSSRKKLRDRSIHELTKRYGGIDKLINSKKQISKDEFKRMLKHNKDNDKDE